MVALLWFFCLWVGAADFTDGLLPLRTYYFFSGDQTLMHHFTITIVGPGAYRSPVSNLAVASVKDIPALTLNSLEHGDRHYPASKYVTPEAAHLAGEIQTHLQRLAKPGSRVELRYEGYYRRLFAYEFVPHCAPGGDGLGRRTDANLMVTSQGLFCDETPRSWPSIKFTPARPAISLLPHRLPEDIDGSSLFALAGEERLTTAVHARAYENVLAALQNATPRPEPLEDQITRWHRPTENVVPPNVEQFISLGVIVSARLRDGRGVHTLRPQFLIPVTEMAHGEVGQILSVMGLELRLEGRFGSDFVLLVRDPQVGPQHALVFQATALGRVHHNPETGRDVFLGTIRTSRSRNVVSLPGRGDVRAIDIEVSDFFQGAATGLHCERLLR